MSVSAVIFDWGGTLSIWAEVEMEDMWRIAAQHLSDDTGLDADIYLQRLVEVERRLWSETAESGGDGAFRLVDIFEAASDDLGADVAEAVLEEAATHHLDTWTPHVSHDPDAAPMLERLSSLGIDVGLLSNTHWPEHFHEHFLERDGLRQHIAACVYTSNESHMKPHPAIFEKTLGLLDADPSETLFVGDRQYDDVLGAQSAGMRAVWKHTRHSVPHDGVTADFVINGLGELPHLIETL